ncbi:RB39B protein, partial [Eudromia elegans]|nr:RB39B protein [Eudromia elegans]
MEPAWHYQIRVIVLGDSTVGKSSLLRRYAHDVFLEAPSHTVGVDFYVRHVELRPGLRVKLQFWDTAGQERFRSVTRSYYRSAAGALLLFDITNRASFESVRRWHRDAADAVRPSRLVFLLVGHKSDLARERRVARAEAERLAAALGAPYMETSAKDASNVAPAFRALALAVVEALNSAGPGALTAGVRSGLSLPPAPRAEEQPKRCAC